MLKISRESEINLINVLIDHDIISGKDLPNIKKLSTEGKKSQIDAVFELKLTNEDNQMKKSNGRGGYYPKKTTQVPWRQQSREFPYPKDLDVISFTSKSSLDSIHEYVFSHISSIVIFPPYQ